MDQTLEAVEEVLCDLAKQTRLFPGLTLFLLFQVAFEGVIQLEEEGLNEFAQEYIDCQEEGF